MAAGSSAIVSTRNARKFAAVFLLAGIILGAFDAPGYLIKLARKASVPTGNVESALAKFPYRFGLDIQGGTHLLYQADLSGIPASSQGDSMESVRDVIERRVNLFGVAEPVVQVEKSGKERRLIVELAGVKDINYAIKLIGETPFLEFKEERPAEERDKILEAQKKGEQPFEDPNFISTELTGRFVKNSRLAFNQTTFQPEVGLELTEEGAKIFAELTKKNIDKRLAIYLDGAPISAPVVREEIKEGKAQITGSFTPQAAKELVGRLNAGALPVPIKLVAQESVQASLGKESLDRSLKAGIMGFLAVAVFMLLWYRLPGFISVLALLLYVSATLAVFKAIPVTLTVAGIAGLILSIGMAVDANILIFERLKEELRQSRGIEEAVREGFGRAWTSIRDSNVSSMITSAILYWFGTSVVKGFALTLGIGILISMFSAISVTRTLLIAIKMKESARNKFMFLSGFTK